MKKHSITVLLAIILIIGIAGLAIASDISGAINYGIITITNNSTAATNVATVFTANTTTMQTNGVINSSCNNTAIINQAGADVAYQPGYTPGGYPWALFVASIEANQQLTNILYTGGPAMGAKIRYFPGATGMLVPDDATLEPGDNFSISLSGWIDTTVSGNLTTKDGAISLYSDGSGNVTATITGGTTASNNLKYSNDAEAHTSNAAYTLIKTIAITTTITDARVKFDLKRNLGTPTAYGKIYFNGVPIGTEQSNATANYVTKTEDLTINAVNGDSLQLYGRSSDGVNDVYYRNFRIYYDVAADVTVSASGLTSGEKTVVVTADSSNMTLTIDGTLKDNQALTGSVLDNSENWTIAQSAVMPYMEYAEITVGGVQKGYWDWEYGATFTDDSGNGNTATPSFLAGSTDPDVSANMTSFAPVAEADAPAYTLTDAPAFFTVTPGMSGNFTTSTVNATYPGHEIITEIAVAAATPEQLPVMIFTTFCLILMALAWSYLDKSTGPDSLFFKSIVIVVLMCILVAVGLWDAWQVYYFTMMALAICWLSRQREAY